MADDIKGVILAGGTGSRLHPTSLAVNKHLMTVGGRPMIHYALATLMLAGIRDITMVVDPESEMQFQRLLGYGDAYGVKLTYLIQEKPEGLADGIRIAAENVGTKPVLAILGDNFFFGPSVGQSLSHVVKTSSKSQVFLKEVLDPRPFGVVRMGEGRSVMEIREKPNKPESRLIATGLYHFRPNDLEHATRLSKSQRGEIEITSLLNILSNKQRLEAITLSRSTFWADLGTFDSIQHTSQFIEAIERTQSISVLAPEIISWSNGWISAQECLRLIESFPTGTKRDLLLFEFEHLGEISP